MADELRYYDKTSDSFKMVKIKAVDSIIDAAGFTKNLTTSTTDVQALANAVDQLLTMPIGGTLEQVVKITASGIAWGPAVDSTHRADTTQHIPSGGTTGQVLTKTGTDTTGWATRARVYVGPTAPNNADYDVWVDTST
jgi:hypothetical protein